MINLFMGFEEEGALGPWLIGEIKDLSTFIPKDGWAYKLIEYQGGLAIMQYTPKGDNK